LQVDDEHYLQWWVDEDDGMISLCWRNGDWDTYVISDLGEYEGEAIKPVFLAYLAGDQSGLAKFKWYQGSRPGDPGVVTTDLWEFYPCKFEDETPASIFYNHGIAEIIDELESSRCIRFRLSLNEPDDDGFPTDEENEILDEIANELDKFVHQNQGIFFGHITNQGDVVLYTYANAEPEQTSEFIKLIQKRFGYELDVNTEEDPERNRYWEDLFPDPFSWQLLNDIKATQQLKEVDDDLEQPRQIDHFTSFDSLAAQTSFLEWAVSEGFKVESSAVDAANLESVNPITYMIREKCDELKGCYDGWEAVVVERSDNSA